MFIKLRPGGGRQRKTDRYVTFGLHRKMVRGFFVFVTRTEAVNVGTFSPARSVSGVIFNVLDQFNRTCGRYTIFSHSPLFLFSICLLSLSLHSPPPFHRSFFSSSLLFFCLFFFRFLLEGETIYSTNAHES